MITAAQLRAARALLGIDQRKLAELSGLSLPTIQRMEASDGVIRGNVDSLMKLVAALDAGGIELIADHATSAERRPRRAAQEAAAMTLLLALSCAAALLATAIVSVLIGRAAVANALIYGLCAAAALISLFAALKHLLGAAPAESMVLPLGIPWIGSHFRLDALSAFFLAVVDLGAVAASVFAIGYGRHEDAPFACCRSIRLSSPA